MHSFWRIEGVAVVTGAARGVGQAVAHRLAQREARVIVADIDVEAAEETASALRQEGLDAISCPVDVSDEGSIDHLAQVAADAGQPVAWVNNAGINALSPLEDLSFDDFERMLRVNLIGCFLGTRAAASVFGEGGSIVNVSSVSATVALPDNSHYGATKGGIEAFSRHAAVDLARRRIRVNCVAPASVRTAMTEPRYTEPGVVEERISRIPLGRIAVPEDIAGPVTFLCSDEASYITGHTLVVDGGRTIF